MSNSSAYTAEGMRTGLDAIERFGMNTVAAPVYWECLEPEEGRYCFSQVDTVLLEASKRGLYVILLWFGTWKNGASHYVPAWMKADRERFFTCRTKSGQKTAALSPLCAEAKQKDKEAFGQLMAHLRTAQGGDRVLAVQVENEPGILGTPRDFSKEAQEAFAAAVPGELTGWLSREHRGRLRDIFEKNGATEGRSWQETFGFDAAEIFSAWQVARYVNEVAQAGKAVHALPLYVNVWVREVGTQIAGLDFPSGGATTLVMELWKRFAPAVDCICPDLYFDDDATYAGLCDSYHRTDNLLYVPESRADERNGMHVLLALQKHGLCGIHCFAVDSVFDRDGALLPAAKAFGDTVAVLCKMKPLLEKYLGTPHLYAVVQQEGMGGQLLDFGDYLGKVDFFDSITDEPYLHLDFAHDGTGERPQKGKGLIVYEGEGSFYLAGQGYKLTLLEKTSPEEMAELLVYHKTLATRNIFYREVQEGYFDEAGRFVPQRRRNGDETDTGLWVAQDVGVVHARLWL